MAAAAVAPELVVAMAIQQYFDASKSLQEASKIVGGDFKFSLAHAFYANMGGLVLKRPGVSIRETDTSISVLTLEDLGKSLSPSVLIPICHNATIQT
jgi:hypothetical protein